VPDASCNLAARPTRKCASLSFHPEEDVEVVTKRKIKRRSDQAWPKIQFEDTAYMASKGTVRN